MSYPAQIQPLIIEDEVPVKDAYDAAFHELAENFDLAPPCYAFCYDEAIQHLKSSKVFHLVLLDLKLPKTRGVPPPDNVDWGVALLRDCANRETYPVPALIIVSGFIAKADQELSRQSVVDGFHYGRVLVKDVEALQKHITGGIKAALEYCRVGVHIRDAGRHLYPTLTPRDEDLIRRVVLKQTGGIGADLQWWSAEHGPGTARSGQPGVGWTKVLMGRFVFENSGGASRPNFFKLMPASSAGSVIRSVERMKNQLPHIKVNGNMACGSTAIIVTEKVGEGDGRPTAMTDFLRSREATGSGVVSRMADEIARQIEKLGDTSPQTRPLRLLLWRHHTKENLQTVWTMFDGEQMFSELRTKHHPITLFDEILSTESQVAFREQSFLHGDLHVGNVALDVTADGADAYIFDANGASPHVNICDLAALEVSILLHQPDVRMPMDALRELYQEGIFVPIQAFGDADPGVCNSFEMVREIRGAAASRSDEAVYRLMVFDQALIQLGGLSWGLSGNKIGDPKDAVKLLALVANWCQAALRKGGVLGV
jgi:CheY-like chemotaxis protein